MKNLSRPSSRPSGVARIAATARRHPSWSRSQPAIGATAQALDQPLAFGNSPFATLDHLFGSHHDLLVPLIESAKPVADVPGLVDEMAVAPKLEAAAVPAHASASAEVMRIADSSVPASKPWIPQISLFSSRK